MKKKIGTLVCLFLEAALVIGGFVVKYFTAKKMGMARHVIYTNQLWEKTYPLALWKMLGIAVLAALMLLTLLLLIRRKKMLTFPAVAEGVLALGLGGYCLYFTLANSAATLRPYYWMVPLFAAAAMIQLVRAAVLLLRK